MVEIPFALLDDFKNVILVCYPLFSGFALLNMVSLVVRQQIVSIPYFLSIVMAVEPYFSC